MVRQVTQCPLCDGRLINTELTCVQCATRLQGVFPAPPLARLPAEHQSFVETFLLCRGVIRDVEKALGLSYPTVRARLDAAVAALQETVVSAPAPGAPAPSLPAADPQQRRRAILDQVASGRLDPAEAAETLRRLG